MQIKEMFNRNIARQISGVIKIGNENDNKEQELEEYVVTKELSKYFAEFFNAYVQPGYSSQKEIGVWISGFYGSGKSHFMKILSYLIDNETVNGKKAVDFFKEGKKIDDPFVLANMEQASQMSSDVILFDIESIAQDKNDKKNAVLLAFLRAFNEKIGYSNNPAIADIERFLDSEGRYEEFKNKYEELNHTSWLEDRKKLTFKSKQFAATMMALDIMSEEDAKAKVKNLYTNYSIAVEDFAKMVNEYCDKKGNNHRVIFLADEMGQFIADDTNLLLNLQAISQDFSTYCKGKAWVVVTSQQSIDQITPVKDQDFSKIQARFNMRLSLSSSDVNEVIQKRVLDKTEVAKQTLMAYYDTKESIIKNLIDFSVDTAYKAKYKNAENFANVYPFIPYQMDLLSKVLVEIRKNSSSGKHLSEGERSMLALIQESAVAVSNQELGTLVSFNKFYDCLEKWIDHSFRNVIDGAKRNEELEAFDVEVLKVLYMVKYVKEIKTDIKNITTLMIDHVDTDRTDLTKRVKDSLDRLIKQTLVQKDGDYYIFLTDVEQDLNKAIKNEYIDIADVSKEIRNIIFGDLYKFNKFKYSNRYSFPFNQRIDEVTYVSGYPIGLMFVTPYSDHDWSAEELRPYSNQQNMAIFRLPNEIDFQSELIYYLQLRQYLTKQHANTDPNFQMLKAIKQEELKNTKERIRKNIEEGIKTADIYVNGSEYAVPSKGVEDRINTALGELVGTVYTKLTYMTTAPEQMDFIKIFTENRQHLEGIETNDNQLALDDMEQHINWKLKSLYQMNYKSVLERYTTNPYGFVNNDVHWLLLKLIKDNKIEVRLNGSTLNTSKYQQLIKLVTDNKNADKLIIKAKPVISEKQKKSVSNICKEIDSTFVKVTDPDELKVKAQELFSTTARSLSQIESNYYSNSRLPGKKEVENYKSKLNALTNINESLDFYQTIDKDYNDIKDVIEDVKPVFAFFKGNQYKLYTDALQRVNSFNESKGYITDQGLSNIIKKIENIINMAKPYNLIKELPVLTNNYDLSYKVILEEARSNNSNQLDMIENSIKDELVGRDDLRDQFVPKIKDMFVPLRNQMKEAKSISNTYSIVSQADFKKKPLIEEINKAKLVVVTPPEGGDSPEIKVVKTYMVSELFDNTDRTITSEAEIDLYLNKIREKLLNEINSNKNVYIKVK